MTEGVQATEDAAAARAAEQARLRKERREAKIKAGGSARLNKITGLGGGIQRDPIPQFSSESGTPPATTTTPSPSTKPTPAPEQNGDPDEVDISQHYYEPHTTARPEPNAQPNDISDAQIRQMLLGLDRSSSGGSTTPPLGRNPLGDGPLPQMPPGMEGLEEDPMMKVLSQFMSGGAGGNPLAGLGGLGGFGGMGPNSSGSGATGFPPGANPMQQAQQVATNKTANLWRILHAVFALGLGLYVAFSTTFTGTLTEREHSSITARTEAAEADGVERARAYFFYVFASVEALLLSTRYFLDRGADPPRGWMWSAAGFLPGRAGTYARRALRYAQVLGTVRSDALVCVFVLGVCSWWRARGAGEMVGSYDLKF